jgi:hypothetical protein
MVLDSESMTAVMVLFAFQHLPGWIINTFRSYDDFNIGSALIRLIASVFFSSNALIVAINY